jgi:hypothetical protein
MKACGSCKNRRFGERIASIISVKRIIELGTMLAVTSNLSTLRRNTNLYFSQRTAVPSFCQRCSNSLNLVTLVMEAIRFPEKSVLIRTSSSLLRLLVTANVVPIIPIVVTLMNKVIHASETSVI